MDGTRRMAMACERVSAAMLRLFFALLFFTHYLDRLTSHLTSVSQQCHQSTQQKRTQHQSPTAIAARAKVEMLTCLLECKISSIVAC